MKLYIHISIPEKYLISIGYIQQRNGKIWRETIEYAEYLFHRNSELTLGCLHFNDEEKS